MGVVVLMGVPSPSLGARGRKGDSGEKVICFFSFVRVLWHDGFHGAEKSSVVNNF